MPLELQEAGEMVLVEAGLCRQPQPDDYFAIKSLSRVQEIILLAIMFSAQGTVQGMLAQGILPDQVIGESFGASRQDIAWFPAAFALTTGIFFLPQLSNG